jgi:hypothetical protein
MHVKYGLALVVAALVVVTVSTFGQSSRARKRTAPPAPAKKAVEKISLVEGYGETAEKARERALERARERASELLEDKLGRSGVETTGKHLDLDTLAKFGVVVSLGDPEPAQVQGEQVLVARYQVKLTVEYLNKLAQEVRHERVQDRHLILARVLAAILAVVLVMAGYLHLEEMTRGYATKLLRLAAVVILALAGAALWLTK